MVGVGRSISLNSHLFPQAAALGPPGMLDLHRVIPQDPLCPPKGPHDASAPCAPEHRDNREALLPNLNC